MFGRSYTPEYPRSKEEFIEMIESKLKYSARYFHENDSPYDQYYNNQTNSIEEVGTEHITMFYKDFILAGTVIKEYKEGGYSYYEASDDLKSIPIPHIHLIRIIKND